METYSTTAFNCIPVHRPMIGDSLIWLKVLLDLFRGRDKCFSWIPIKAKWDQAIKNKSSLASCLFPIKSQIQKRLQTFTINFIYNSIVSRKYMTFYTEFSHFGIVLSILWNTLRNPRIPHPLIFHPPRQYSVHQFHQWKSSFHSYSANLRSRLIRLCSASFIEFGHSFWKHIS